MNITVADLKKQVAFLKARGQISVIRRVLDKNKHHSTLTPELVVAFASRETNCQNIAGDGGHGRGFVQIDDRYHADWLKAHAGCKSGSFATTKGHRAIEKGYVPSMTAQILFLIDYFDGAIEQAKKIGVPEGQRVKFALSAWNAGLGGATSGFKNHGDSDHNTAHGDYGKDTLERRNALKGMI